MPRPLIVVPKLSRHCVHSPPSSLAVPSRQSARAKDGISMPNADNSFSGSEDVVQMRRFLLMSTTLSLASTVFPSWAVAANDRVTAGLQNYMKKKRVDKIDSYVPTLLNARSELIRLDRVMVQDPKGARAMLRSGGFSGVREAIRAVNEYSMAQSKEPKGPDFLKALEELDFGLLSASRSEMVDGDVLRSKLKLARDSLEIVLNELPKDVLIKGEDIVKAATSEERTVDEEELKSLSKLL